MNKETQDLVDAVEQVLDDMGREGHSCCLFAKAKLRVAFETFRELSPEYYMELDKAKKIIEDCEC